MKIYVASSWRNHLQPSVVQCLRMEYGHHVYDFRHPTPDNDGFSWSEIEPEWKSWVVEEYIRALHHPRAEEGFSLDFEAMKWADACVMVLPCGRSAHLEAGWFVGAGKPLIIYIQQMEEADLMYKMTPYIASSMAQVVDYLARL